MVTPRDPVASLDALRAQLVAQVNELVNAARANGGQVPAESLANAQRLAQLTQLQRELTPSRRGSRWIVAALFAATLVVASVLLASVRETEVELDLTVSELRFTLDSPQQITELQQLASLGASGLAGIALPGTDIASRTPATGVRLAAAPSGAAAGTISLAPIAAPARSEVSLRIGDAPGEVRVSIKGLDAALRADVSGTIGVALPRRPKQVLDAATPQAIWLTPGPADLDLDLAPLNAAAAVFAPEITITDLALMRIDEVSQGGRTTVRRVSTVQGGSVYFDELGGRELRLRAHEALRFTRARGEIRSLRASGGQLAINFHGRVSGMTSGPLEHPRDLMPRWLDWLRANQPLSLLWSATAFLFGLLTAIWQWWKKNR
jgi:hypothetical protein